MQLAGRRGLLVHVDTDFGLGRPLGLVPAGDQVAERFGADGRSVDRPVAARLDQRGRFGVDRVEHGVTELGM